MNQYSYCCSLKVILTCMSMYRNRKPSHPRHQEGRPQPVPPLVLHPLPVALGPPPLPVLVPPSAKKVTLNHLPVLLLLHQPLWQLIHSPLLLVQVKLHVPLCPCSTYIVENNVVDMVNKYHVPDFIVIVVLLCAIQVMRTSCVSCVIIRWTSSSLPVATPPCVVSVLPEAPSAVPSARYM